MPVVTALFRNLFDMIFTIFYGCRTVFNGESTTHHPATTIWSSVQKVSSVLNRTDLDPPWHTVPTSQCPPCCTLGCTVCPGRLCGCVGVCSVLVCALRCCVVCGCCVPVCMCVSTPWFGPCSDDILVIFLAL